MPAKVLSLKEDSFDGSDGKRVVCWKVELDDKTTSVPCYSAEAANLKIGEPLPEGWMVKVSAKGKDYLAVPKQGKGGGFAQSWYNSEAGVRFTQERMDRRTALMQAVEIWTAPQLDNVREAVIGGMAPSELADILYEWLRASDSPSIGAAEGAPITSAVGGGGTRTDPKPPERPVTGMGKAQPVEGGGAETSGLDAASSPTICEHIHTSPLRPDGTEMPISKVRCLDCGKAVPA